MNSLTADDISVLRTALEDEYHSWATYDQVITDFGEARPFNNIRDAEARHIEALCTLFSRYGLAIPQNQWPGNVVRYDSLHAACEAAVAAETANVEMYKRLISQTQRPDIPEVLRKLQAASQQRHLVAFQRCVDRIADGRGGQGNRGGPGSRGGPGGRGGPDGRGSPGA